MKNQAEKTKQNVILILMQEIDNDPLMLQFYQEEYDKEINKKQKNKNSDFLLSRTLKAFEQIIHHNKFLDKSLSKTEYGKLGFNYRCLMRFLIANKQKHINYITNNQQNDVYKLDPRNEKIRKELFTKFGL